MPRIRRRYHGAGPEWRTVTPIPLSPHNGAPLEAARRLVLASASIASVLNAGSAGRRIECGRVPNAMTGHDRDTGSAIRRGWGL